jgi:hypothetical protein
VLVFFTENVIDLVDFCVDDRRLMPGCHLLLSLLYFGRACIVSTTHRNRPKPTFERIPAELFDYTLETKYKKPRMPSEMAVARALLP